MALELNINLPSKESKDSPQEKTKGWTVGPYDFVDDPFITAANCLSVSASGIYSGGSTVDLCQPDAGYTGIMGCSKSLSTGMQKMTAEQIKAEKTWQSKVKSSIVKELGEAAAASASPDFLSREIRLRRKQERDKLKKKSGLSCLMMASIKLDSTLHTSMSTPQWLQWTQKARKELVRAMNKQICDEPADKGEGVVANSRGDNVLPIAELNAREDIDIWNKNSETEDEMFREAAGVKNMLSKRETQETSVSEFRVEDTAQSRSDVKEPWCPPLIVNAYNEDRWDGKLFFLNEMQVRFFENRPHTCLFLAYPKDFTRYILSRSPNSSGKGEAKTRNIGA
ncbi:hypothetical protein C8R44DRAFT_751802 [Mycena epipterygia]|nr:hypothetical protein C8R44DRAFT_751802 [Mycena epipterygia]